MAKKITVRMTLAALAAALLPFAVSGVQAQAGQITKAEGLLNMLAVDAEHGLVQVSLTTQVWSGEGPPSSVPAVLCAGASSAEGKLVAYIPDTAQYRTLIERLVENHGGKLETREGRDGRCYVTRWQY